MDAGDDHTSRLTTDLLALILRLVSAKDGAAASMVSKRWAPIWRSSGAVNLEARILRDDENLFDRFLEAARKALDAFTDAPVPVTMLSFRVEGEAATLVRDFLNREVNWQGYPQLPLAGILSHQAARVVEEIRISAVDNVDGDQMLFELQSYEAEWATFGIRMYRINLQSLPSGTLHVLDLLNCGGLDLTPGSAPPVFPLLLKLRLRHCQLLIEGLQGIINSAPHLASIQLESVLLENNRAQLLNLVQPPPVRSLNCPTATTLVISKCCLKEGGILNIVAPMLQRFQYKGVLRHIGLTPTPQDLLRAHVTLIDYRGANQGRDAASAGQSFWGLLRGFAHAKQVYLRMRLVEEIDVPCPANLLPVLHKVEGLDLNLVYSPTSPKATILIADLLSCCPNLLSLRIILTTIREDTVVPLAYSSFVLKSMSRPFYNDIRHAKRIAAQQEPDYFDNLPQLPGLSDHQFDCLNSSLKRVALQFRQREESYSFGVLLTKFFAENAKVLEKMRLDGGNALLNSHHLHVMVEKWIAGWPEDRRRFKVSPLKREIYSRT